MRLICTNSINQLLLSGFCAYIKTMQSSPRFSLQSSTTASWRAPTALSEREMIANMFSCIVLSFIVLVFGYSFCSQFEPVLVAHTVVNGSSETCPDQSSTQSAISTLNEEVYQALVSDVQPYLDNRFGPPCLSQPCGTNDWNPLTVRDFNQSGDSCFPSLTLVPTPVRSCGRTSPDALSCDSAVLSTYGSAYTKVCGTITAYQFGSAGGFVSDGTIEDAYLTGVSVTYGGVHENICGLS